MPSRRSSKRTYKGTSGVSRLPSTQAKHCVENAMYFTGLLNKEMFPAQTAMHELEKIVSSNLGRRISQEAGLPEDWYEDASEAMWTGYLGLWTRHFEMLR